MKIQGFYTSQVEIDPSESRNSACLSRLRLYHFGMRVSRIERLSWRGITHAFQTHEMLQSEPANAPNKERLGVAFFFVKKTLSRNERWKQSGFAGFEVRMVTWFSQHIVERKTTLSLVVVCKFSKHIHQVMAVAMSTRNPCREAYYHIGLKGEH